MRALPILSPCSETFEAMEGDAKRRHCAECNEDVHDLSAGTEEDARALLREAAGKRICVRYAATPSGTIRFRATLTVAAVATAAVVAGCSSVDMSGPAPAARPMAVAHPDGGADANERVEIMMGQYVEDDRK